MKIINFFVASILILLLIFSCKSEVTDVNKFHQSLLTIDTHVDIPIKLTRDSTYNLEEEHTFKEAHTRTDFPRMNKGGLDAIVFTVWTAQGKCDSAETNAANDKAHKIIETIHSRINSSTQAELAFSADDIVKINQAGKHPIVIGMENGYPVGKEISNVEHFYNLGIRYITLCHVEDNDICDSSTDESEDEGLSDFGINVIKEMNRLGIIIDVSHISDNSFYQVMKLSKAPVIASHSNARALCNHPRNLTDNMLKKLAKNGGVISVNFYRGYLVEDESDSVKTKASVEDVLNHIDYIAKLIGVNHVGIGSDFDGGGGVEGLEDISQMINITKGLLARGYSKEDIQKIWSGNFLRVFKEVEKVSILIQQQEILNDTNG